jgi:ribosomal protein S27AE
MNKKFWIVWSMGCVANQHNNIDDAIKESKRISSVERLPVYVLECIGVSAVQSVAWTDYRVDSQPPTPTPEVTSINLKAVGCPHCGHTVVKMHHQNWFECNKCGWCWHPLYLE